jgi:hypothetical protein
MALGKARTQESIGKGARRMDDNVVCFPITVVLAGTGDAWRASNTYYEIFHGSERGRAAAPK